MKPLIKYQAQAVEILKKPLMHTSNILTGIKEKPLIDIRYINSGKYAVIKYKYDNIILKYGIRFTKEHWHSFYKFFPNEPKGSQGQTVNAYEFLRYFEDCEYLYYVIQTNYELEYYRISIKLIKKLFKIKKAYIYENKSDGKNEIVFNITYLERVNI